MKTQLFTWRRDARQAGDQPTPMFAPVVVDIPLATAPPPRDELKAKRARRARRGGIELEIDGVVVPLPVPLRARVRRLPGAGSTAELFRGQGAPGPHFKNGDGYLRKLLVVGATSVIRRAKSDALAAAPWVRSLLERRPARVVTVAMANKTARIAWAVMNRGEVYRPVAA